MKLKWDQMGEKTYETGASKGVLYPMTDGVYGAGVAWNGLTKVTESPSGAEATSLYADDAKYLSLMSAEEYGCTIEAYMSPEEFDACDGSVELADGLSVGQQTRKSFGFSYQTLKGNDTKGIEFGKKIHIVYGCLASPSSRDHATVNESVEASTLSWEVKATPVAVEGLKPTATVTIDGTKITAEKLKAIEDILYGTDDQEARLPLPDELKTILAAA